MAENYNLNSSFGFNVTKQAGKQFEAAKKITQEVSEGTKNIFESMTSYVAKYENVLNGDVSRDINMYSRQAMIVGMNLKAADTRRNFDVSI